MTVIISSGFGNNDSKSGTSARAPAAPTIWQRGQPVVLRSTPGLGAFQTMQQQLIEAGGAGAKTRATMDAVHLQDLLKGEPVVGASAVPTSVSPLLIGGVVLALVATLGAYYKWG